MTYIDDLKTARDNLATRIKDLTAQPKPNYSIDGQTVSWGDYLRQLLASQKEIEAAIVDAELASDGPFEVISQGFT